MWKFSKNGKNKLTMNLKKTLEEELDGLWNNRQYGGASESPRKDYQPYSSSNGYSFPYQAGSPPVMPPTAPSPEGIPSMPWPLETVSVDLADAFVYLISAFNKLNRCIEENPSLNTKQRSVIKILLKLLKGSLLRIEKVGNNIVRVANLASDLPPQSPS